MTKLTLRDEDGNEVCVINMICDGCEKQRRSLDRLSYMLYALIFALLFTAYNAHAADIGCGRDTDRSGTVDNLCPGSDKDFDGYTVAQGDCDDEDWEIWPGTPSTKGLSAGHYRVCKADGSGWTADTTSSVTPYCPSGDYTTTSGKSALACKYIDYASGNDSTGDGSWSTPWKTPNKISYNNGSKYTVQAGDAIVIKAGTYPEDAQTDAANDSVLFFARSGNSTNPIWIVGYPGTRPVFTGQANFYATDYVKFWNIEITHGNVDSSGFAAREGSDTVDLAMLYIHDKTGQRENNQACIKFSQGGTDNYVHHNYVSDCNDPGDGTQPNGGGILMMQQTLNDRVEYNSIINSVGGSEACIYEKHVYLNSSGTIKGNYCVATFTSGSNSAVGIESSGAFDRDIKNNLLIVTDAGISLKDSGGNTYWGDGVFENNTIISKQAVAINFDWRWNTAGTYTASNCGGDAAIGAPYVFRYNIIKSTESTFRPIEIGTYDADASYTLWTTDGMWTSSSNGYYSTGSATLKMGLFLANNGCSTECCEQGSLGSDISGLAAIQSAGYEASSIQADPQLASGTYISEHASMTTWGYMSPGAEPDPTATSNPLSARAIRRVFK